MSTMLSLLVSSLLWLPHLGSANKILMLGDSMGEYAGKSIEDFCKGSTVYNAAIGGTTAVDWTSGDHLVPIGGQTCGGTPDRIWLSIGGNDNWGCDKTVDQLASLIKPGIAAVKAKAPGVPILMTGYCMPNSPEAPDAACNTPEKFGNLKAAVQKAAEESGATFVDVTDACGGSSTAWSPQGYFIDAIHLNNRGYCKVATKQEIQTALGCQVESYDCDSVPCEMKGLDQNCAGGEANCGTCGTYCSASGNTNTGGETSHSRGAHAWSPLMVGIGLLILWQSF